MPGLIAVDVVDAHPAQIERRKVLPFEAGFPAKPLLSADEQATAWTEAFGAW